MKITYRIRASGIVWAAPFAFGLVIFYFFVSYGEVYRFHQGEPVYAPAVVSRAMSSMYAIVYAVASCLGVWESGRLRLGGIWRSAPARSRVVIAADALMPVLVLVWGMVALAVLLVSVRQQMVPSPSSLILPFLAMAVAAAHAVIGFCAGILLPRLIAAPVLAVLTFYLVGGSWSYEPFWYRHVSGQWPVEFALGELPTATSLIPHLLFTGSLATAFALLVLPTRAAWIRIAVAGVACGIGAGGPLVARSMVVTWGPVPPLSAGHAPTECVGTTPRICVPAGGAVSARTVQEDIDAAFLALEEAGVTVRAPQTISDSALGGRHTPRSDSQTWWLPVTRDQARGTIRLSLLPLVARPACDDPDPVARRGAELWAARVLGEEATYLERALSAAEQSPGLVSTLDTAVERVASTHGLSVEEQAAWFTAEKERACTVVEEVGH